MKPAVKRWVTIASVLFAGWVVVQVYLAGKEEVPPPQTAAPVTFGRGSARGERVNGHSWSIDYDKVSTSPDETFVTAEGVRDGIIYKAGKPYLRIRAQHMTVNMVTHDFVATGPVHIESVGHKNFHAFDTTSAVWTEATQRLAISPSRSSHVSRHVAARATTLARHQDRSPARRRRTREFSRVSPGADGQSLVSPSAAFAAFIAFFACSISCLTF